MSIQLAAGSRHAALSAVWRVALRSIVGLGLLAAWQPAIALGGEGNEWPTTVQIDRADSHALKALDQARAYLADRQWKEGIDGLIRIMETSGEKLVPVTPTRYLRMREACQLQLIALPPEALALYRRRVDPQAQRLYKQAAASGDRGRLEKVVEEYLASSWADDALLLLGEMALESGDCASARAYWERILPVDRPDQAPPAWPAVPHTDLDLAGIRARLVLASILEGALVRAQEELSRFAQRHPTARGQFGGRDVNYLEALTALLADAAHWPMRVPSGDWPTLGGSFSRNAVAPKLGDVGAVVWRLPLRLEGFGRRPPGSRALSGRQPSWVAQDPPPFFPVVVGNKVFVNQQNRQILAVDLFSGRPIWGRSEPVLFSIESDQQGTAAPPEDEAYGQARYTLSVHGDRLYARVGSPITGLPSGPFDPRSPNARPSFLICLELNAEGRLAWQIEAEPGWAFEGSPVADDRNVYVAMRRSGVQPQVHAAAYDAATGQLRWRRLVCGADSPTRGRTAEITHILLTLYGNALYVNTNLGVIAALGCEDGLARWVVLYRRGERLDPNLSRWPSARDVNPCVYHSGVLAVAPADAPWVFGLDALTGHFLWQAGHEAAGIDSLLGGIGDTLIGSGKAVYGLWCRGGQAGRIRYVWPDGGRMPGYGRGVLAGDCVLWPTWEKIYVLDLSAGRVTRSIDLVGRGVTGGNLLVAQGHLLIATATELVALGPSAGQSKPSGSMPWAGPGRSWWHEDVAKAWPVPAVAAP